MRKKNGKNSELNHLTSDHSGSNSAEGPPAHREQAHNWPLSSTHWEQNPPPLTGLILLSPCSSATCWWVGIPPHPQWKWREGVQPAPATSLGMLHSVLPNAFLFPLQQPCQTAELVVSSITPLLTFEFLLDLIWFLPPSPSLQFCFLGHCGCLPLLESFFFVRRTPNEAFFLQLTDEEKSTFFDTIWFFNNEWIHCMDTRPLRSDDRWTGGICSAYLNAENSPVK